MPKLLVIDDRDQTIEMCHRHLPAFEYVTRCDREIPCQVCDQRDRGCPLKCAHDHHEAAEVLARERGLPDLVVLDLHFALPEERLLPVEKPALPDDPRERRRALEPLRRRQGLLILERLRRDYPSLPVILMTTTDLEPPRGDGGPVAADPLLHFCENEIVDARSLAAEIRRVLNLQHEAAEGRVFWGASPAMAELRRGLQVLARSPLPVLIEGETGTGKSFLAEQVLHARAGLKGPFVVTDLSTVPASLLPAHLFGARRGSFTGAVQDQAGVFEQAQGGTLFLDEIGNLDLDLQRQLLLVLERGEVQRLGDARPRKIDVKLVAATNVDLAAAVRAGRFRADLYMRLNPATRLRVPALRERAADVPDLLRFAVLEALASEPLAPLVRQYLARHPTPRDFDARHNTLHVGKPSAAEAPDDAFAVFLSRGSLERLRKHAWPGNTRELKSFAMNILVWALGQGDGAPSSARAPAILAIPDRVVAQLLLETELTAAPAPRATVDGGQIAVVIEPGASFAQVSAAVERQYLTALFHACEGDLDLMARRLLGARGTARKVHLRLNQLGLGLRQLRGRA